MRKSKLPEHIIHVAVALLEAQQIGQGGGIGGDTEAVRLPLTHRHP